MSDSVGPHPWDSPGKNTGVGCHFLLQCMKVKSESEVAQSCLTLCNPMDCNLPGSSVHGIFQARVLEWGAIAFSDSRLYFLPKSIISGSLQGFNPLDLRLQGFIPFLFFGSTAPSVLLWFWPRLCLQAALVSVPHPDKRA